MLCERVAAARIARHERKEEGDASDLVEVEWEKHSQNSVEIQSESECSDQRARDTKISEEESQSKKEQP